MTRAFFSTIIVAAVLPINAGAAPRAPLAPKAAVRARLQIQLSAITLVGPRVGRQLQVSLRASMGEARDVTAEAQFSVSPAGVAEVSPTGWVTALKDAVSGTSSGRRSSRPLLL